MKIFKNWCLENSRFCPWCQFGLLGGRQFRFHPRPAINPIDCLKAALLSSLMGALEIFVGWVSRFYTVIVVEGCAFLGTTMLWQSGPVSEI